MTEKFLPSWVPCLDEACLHGSPDGHVLDGSSALGSLILLAMNIIPCVVVIVASGTKSNWLKAKMLQHLILNHIPTKAEEQSVFDYDSVKALRAEEW
jgi:hypothetical protein